LVLAFFTGFAGHRDVEGKGIAKEGVTVYIKATTVLVGKTENIAQEFITVTAIGG
jgi:hypothetical protein